VIDLFDEMPRHANFFTTVALWKSVWH